MYVYALPEGGGEGGGTKRSTCRDSPAIDRAEFHLDRRLRLSHGAPNKPHSCNQMAVLLISDNIMLQLFSSQLIAKVLVGGHRTGP